MNHPKRAKKATVREIAYIRDLRKRSALDMLETGEATLLEPTDYPEPLRRFLLRERTMVHVKLTLATKRRLEARSRRLGIPVDDLARQWIEQRLKRTTA